MLVKITTVLVSMLLETKNKIIRREIKIVYKQVDLDYKKSQEGLL